MVELLCRLLTAWLLLVAATGPVAKEAEPAAADPVLEARVQRITAELRCLVCQNQTIADSHAELAMDLKNQVRTMVGRGDSDAQILDYMTARYGDFVLYRPPVKGTTLLLWTGPALLVLAGLTVLIVVLRRRAKLPDDQFEPDEEGEADASIGAAAGGASPSARSTS